MVMTPVSGIITDRKGPGYIIPVGIVLLLLGSLPLTVLHTDTSYAYFAGALFVRGLGIGGCMMPVFASAFRRLPREHVPQASTTISVIMQVGGSFGAAILVMELSRRISHNFSAAGIPVSGGGTSSLSSIPPAMFAHVAPLVSDAFGYAFWYVVVLTAVALIPAGILLWTGRGGSAPGGPPPTPGA
jgi:MFS family permease